MADDAYLYHPGVLYWDLPSGFGGKLDPVPPRLVVMHKTANPKAGARGEAQYAATRPVGDPSISSAHFYVDGKEIIGSVPLNYRAWSAHHFGNSNGWHIESCGLVGTFMTDADKRCAGLVRELCTAWKIPMVYLTAEQINAGAHGITGHHDIVLATGVGDHTDPGWSPEQWAQFIALVVGGAGGGQDMLLGKVKGIDTVYVGTSQASRPLDSYSDGTAAGAAAVQEGFAVLKSKLGDPIEFTSLAALEAALGKVGGTPVPAEVDAAALAAELAPLMPPPPVYTSTPVAP